MRASSMRPPRQADKKLPTVANRNLEIIYPQKVAMLAFLVDIFVVKAAAFFGRRIDEIGITLLGGSKGRGTVFAARLKCFPKTFKIQPPWTTTLQVQPRAAKRHVARLDLEYVSVNNTPTGGSKIMTNLETLYRSSLALLTDLYQVTMAYGYWKTGRAERE